MGRYNGFGSGIVCDFEVIAMEVPHVSLTKYIRTVIIPLGIKGL